MGTRHKIISKNFIGDFFPVTLVHLSGGWGIKGIVPGDKYDYKYKTLKCEDLVSFDDHTISEVVVKRPLSYRLSNYIADRLVIEVDNKDSIISITFG